jgi:hypothetical protein
VPSARCGTDAEQACVEALRSTHLLHTVTLDVHDHMHHAAVVITVPPLLLLLLLLHARQVCQAC